MMNLESLKFTLSIESGYSGKNVTVTFHDIHPSICGEFVARLDHRVLVELFEKWEKEIEDSKVEYALKDKQESDSAGGTTDPLDGITLMGLIEGCDKAFGALDDTGPTPRDYIAAIRRRLGIK